MKQTSPGVQREAAALYATGLSARAIGLRLGVSSTAVFDSLKRQGVPRRPMRCKDNTPLTEDVKGRVVALYLAGAHTYAVAAATGVSQKSVCKTLARKGIPLRPIEEVNRNPGVVHDFFDSVDTPAKAWLLGFLAADGCIVRGRNAIVVQVAEKDEEVIETIRGIVCPGNPSHKKSHYSKKAKRVVGNVVIRWSSLQMRTSLQKLGLVPRKTYNLAPWEGPEHLLPAYYRGLIDGDGTWAIRRLSGEVAYVGLYGTREIVEGFARFAHSHTGCGPAPRSVSGSAGWRVHVGGGNIIRRLVTVLYADGGPCLLRKRERAMRMIEQTP